MQIVIKIDEYDKEWIHNAWDIPDEIKSKVVDAIENGTPLPKGHGRLIDADALYENTEICHSDIDGYACARWKDINDAPTIIEADK